MEYKYVPKPSRKPIEIMQFYAILLVFLAFFSMAVDADLGAAAAPADNKPAGGHQRHGKMGLHHRTGGKGKGPRNFGKQNGGANAATPSVVA